MCNFRFSCVEPFDLVVCTGSAVSRRLGYRYCEWAVVDAGVDAGAGADIR